MKIIICANKFQKIAAQVSAYSFRKYGFYDIEIIELDNIFELNSKLNKTYIRNKKKVKFINDLQSFTLLRFYPFEQKKIKNCLIIDPDVFAIQNPKQELDNFLLKNDFKIACTKIDNNFRSEVMLLKDINFDWTFNELINDLFEYKLDYKDLIYLKSKKFFSNIIELPIRFNHHDIIKNDTILLHTSKRITQPWKYDLEIDFNDEKKTYFYKLKQLLKKFLKIKYDKTTFSKKYLMHNDKLVYKTISNLFLKAFRSGSFTIDDINIAIDKKYLSSKFLKDINKELFQE